MTKVLLHICCGVCAFYCIDYLKEKGFEVVGYFFNPNIYPEEEYKKRKDTLYTVASLTSTKIIEGDYLNKEWEELCKVYREEPEGGKRCELCYKIRLEETARKTKELNFDYFTTTLTISPHKKSKVIFDIATSIDKNKFLFIDFKKNDGFKKTIELAKKYSLYRQNYCGCRYSL